MSLKEQLGPGFSFCPDIGARSKLHKTATGVGKGGWEICLRLGLRDKNRRYMDIKYIKK